MLQFFNDLYLNIKINDAKMKKSEDDGAGLPFASSQRLHPKNRRNAINSRPKSKIVFGQKKKEGNES